MGVLLELGRVPLHLYATQLTIKNWERIKRGQANSILLVSYKDAIDEGLPWTNNIKSILETNGMLSFYLNDYSEKPPFIYKKLFQRLSDAFHQNSFESIKRTSSKIRTFAIFKKTIGFEKYLSEIKNVTVRNQVTKFRLSNHGLMIEVGRHKGIRKEERLSPFCPQQIEKEAQLLFECSVYNHQRELLLNPIAISIPDFAFLAEHTKVQLVMLEMNANISNYIANCLRLRTFLASRPKRLI